MALRKTGIFFLPLVILSGLAIFFCHPAQATEFTSLVTDGPVSTIQGRLLVSQTAITPDESFTAGLELLINEGWHIYGPKKEKIGLPTKISWEASGLVITPAPFPPAQANIYKNRVLFLAQATLPENPVATNSELKATIEFLACNSQGCTPIRKTFSRKIELGAENRTADEDEVQDLLWAASLTPLETAQNSDDAGTASQPPPQEPIPAIQPSDTDEVAAATDLPSAEDFPFIIILLLACAGGFILNFMPCVLPIISLKIFSLCQNRQYTAHQRLHLALFFAGGLLTSMWLLAATVIFLQKSGTALGWGFQFHYQPYVVAVTLVLAIVAFNLFGIFDFTWTPLLAGRLQKKARIFSGSTRQFFDGVLTVAISTPCSAPLLAPALAVAFSGSPATITAIFTAIGVGLALPYLIFSLTPGLYPHFPRSGPWMNRLKTIFGFVLFIFIIWLCAVVGNGFGQPALIHLLILLLIAAFTLWLYGQFRHQLLLLLLPLAIGVLYFRPSSTTEQPLWATYQPQKVVTALQNGQPVFVEFTADWCLTCQQNEKLALTSRRFLSTAREKNILLLKADWTRRDETILQTLKHYGKAGVPLYLYFSPADPEHPVILPEILTPEILLSNISAAK